MKLFECYCKDNFFSESELEEIWAELDSCHSKNLFSTHAVPFHLDEFSKGETKVQQAVDKLCNGDTCEFFDIHLNHRCVMFTRFSDTYLNCCINNTELPLVHSKPSFVTAIFWLCKDSEDIKGSDIYFEEIDETFEFRNNRLLMFLSHAKHSFTPVSSDLNAVERGKHTIVTFMS